MLFRSDHEPPRVLLQLKADLGSMLTALGVGSVVLGLALQDTVSGLFWHFLLVSLLAVGGLNSVIPDIQRYVVEQGWLTARQFGEIYALSQATPGPNVMILTMLGTIVAGWAGAIAATAGLFLPGTVVTLATIYWQARNPERPFLAAIRRGMAPIAIGLTASTGWVMFSALFPHWDLASLAAE